METETFPTFVSIETTAAYFLQRIKGVTLNGELKHEAVEADSERGYVDVLRYCSLGGSDTHRLFGDVKIIWK